MSSIDKNNKIRLPVNLTADLAYLIGVHIGDGSMNYYRYKNDYRISYTGHLIDEYDWYINLLVPIIINLFNKNPKVRKVIRPRKNSVELYMRSKGILQFLHNGIGLPLGPKINLKIPKLILNSDRKIKKCFLMGLADTEFCVTFKKRNKDTHYYPVIEYSTSDYLLMESVIELLREFGISGYVLKKYQTKRNNSILSTNQLHLNGENNLMKWMNIIGFKSEKHLTKIEFWKKFGMCPPNTNLLERRMILNGELDVLSYYY